MIKFVSKASNYRVTIRQGIPAEPVTGRAAVPGEYVKFEGGIVSVTEEMAEKLRLHPRFNIDFRCIEEVEPDPYALSRREIEPEHIISKMEFGHVTGLTKSPSQQRLSPEQMKMVTEVATKMAEEIAKSMLVKMAQDVKEEKVAPQSTPDTLGGPIDQKQDKEAELSPEEASTLTEEEVAFVCNKCGKIAKTRAGLMAHQRNCKG